MPEKYGLEQARDEADILKRKIKWDDAKSYEEADKLRDKELVNPKVIKPQVPPEELAAWGWGQPERGNWDKEMWRLYEENKDLIYKTDDGKNALPRYILQIVHDRWRVSGGITQSLDRYILRGAMTLKEIFEFVPREEMIRIYRKKESETIKSILLSALKDSTREPYFRNFVVAKKEKGLQTEEIKDTVIDFIMKDYLPNKEGDIPFEEKLDRSKAILSLI